ncbi:hypothetical protein GW579_06700 [Rahnella sp. Lac-M11]|uniref:Acyltransferase n=1 Tax=Rahnella contaminans TaxID=2703882 RepID=A0A6M2B2R4_9GAMM|nr:hypothetical protein [Rahnella contaminans]MDF1894666.1 hypothetical protein [Rahnella contaminans]NGX86781.1 hypothetical protein [Rahnella contaminans]
MTFEEFIALVELKGGKVIGKPSIWKSVKIDLRGLNSNFEFHENSKIDNLTLVDYGGNNNIKIGKYSKVNGLIKIGRKCNLKIGSNFSSTGGMKLHLSESSDIIIGDNCMFGIDINIYNHDYHPIFSIDTGERLNFSKSVYLEDHIWLANKTTILKGVTISTGSVIGIGSVVSKDIPPNSIAVGNPAIVVKSGITWDRASLNTSHLDGIKHFDEI